MIERMTPNEIDAVADIWLEGNLDAHNFINAKYWKRSFPVVKKQLANSEIYVYKDNSEIAGFVGLNGNYIEGVFVKKEFRSKGIGKELFDYIKQAHDDLIISCYVKNFKAINFYRVNGFSIKAEGIDKDTGESEITMIWRK
ncbi:GNAT family N-acetyltransferase [Companilactobacillus hulinensis]|uniref:GNAT family N-acetyltransferase n=1 Tax=Companilactobacillus hulinensis TaxID=2486007 RepID=UPI000F77375E|nr:GNAT family N-acetyltransferase [Companilactobacillus hulinensis]